MHKSIASLIIISVIGLGVVNAQDKPQVKMVPLSQTSPASGNQMFATYCAVCHGADGRGNGPAAGALKTQPANLTQLAAKNNGNYPQLQVLGTLSAKNVAAHGSQEMPIWGDLFKSLDIGNRQTVELRLLNLTTYIQSIQEK
jgi:mono/diheme cytochrome c family protein